MALDRVAVAVACQWISKFVSFVSLFVVFCFVFKKIVGRGIPLRRGLRSRPDPLRIGDSVSDSQLFSGNRRPCPELQVSAVSPLQSPWPEGGTWFDL